MYQQIVGTNVRILGTMHAFPVGSLGMPQRCIEAFGWADHRLLEHNKEHMPPLMVLPEGKSLSDLLSPEAVAKVREYWPLTAPHPLERTKPWAAMILSNMTAVRMEAGVEDRLVALTGLDGQWNTMETAEECAQLFDAIPLAALERAIEWAAVRRDRAQANFQAMYDAWVAQDEFALLTAAGEAPMVRDPDLRVNMLDRRNELWADRIVEFMVASPYKIMLAVGVFHLVGEGSLIEVLARRGLAVERV